MRAHLALPAFAAVLLGCGLQTQPVPRASATPAVRTATATPASSGYAAYEGTYRTDGGSLVVITIQGWVVDLRTGSVRALVAKAAPDTFTFGPRFMVFTPVTGEIHFTVNSSRRMARFEEHIGSAPVVTATRVPFNKREVSIPANGGVNLAGTLTEPTSPGPHPGIVITHGAGREVRTDPDLFVNLFASEGFTVLGYDKRGVGDSGGDYPGEFASTSNLQAYADDAATVVRFLRGVAGVDPKRVGIYGGSQAGWVIPLAAEQLPTLAFAIIDVGPAVTVDQQGTYAAFYGGAEATRIPPESDAEIDAAVRAVTTGYDPGPTLHRLTPPTLWLLGGRDRRVPTRVSVEYLTRLHKPNITVRVVPEADHGLLDTPDGLDTQAASASRFASAVFDDIIAFVE